MKIAIITGGSRGLGRNTAEHLAARGVGIILTYNSGKAEADAVVASIEQAGGKAVALPLDVSKSSTFADFASAVKASLQSKWGRADFNYLINNAGTGLHAPLAETTEEQFDSLCNIHFKAVFFLTNELVPFMIDGGRVINISSGLARFAMPGSGAYAAMKGAVEVLSRYQAREFGARKITVNVVAPGAIETDFRGGAVRDNPEVNKMVASFTTLGRVGLPDDIGGAISTLLMDENRWMTAQRIEVSGGMFI